MARIRSAACSIVQYSSSDLALPLLQWCALADVSRDTIRRVYDFLSHLTPICALICMICALSLGEKESIVR